MRRRAPTAGPAIDKDALPFGTAPRGTGRIDRTDPALAVPEPPRHRNKAFLDSARGRPCDVPGCPGGETVVGAHIRHTMPGRPGAAGTKPPDNVLFLCHRCHDRFDRRTPTTDGEYRDFLMSIIVGLADQRGAAFRRARARHPLPAVAPPTHAPRRGARR